MGEEKTLWVRIPILTAFLPVRIGILTHNLPPGQFGLQFFVLHPTVAPIKARCPAMRAVPSGRPTQALCRPRSQRTKEESTSLPVFSCLTWSIRWAPAARR